MASGRTWGGNDCHWYIMYDKKWEQLKDMVETFIPNDKEYVFIPECQCCGAAYRKSELKKEHSTQKYTQTQYIHINNVLKFYEIDMIVPLKIYLCEECVFECCFLDSVIDRQLITGYSSLWSEYAEDDEHQCSGCYGMIPDYDLCYHGEHYEQCSDCLSQMAKDGEI